MRFIEDKRKTYTLQWSELLREDETPFTSLEELTPDIKVLAPWVNEDGAITHSLARTVIPKGKCRDWYVDML